MAQSTENSAYSQRPGETMPKISEKDRATPSPLKVNNLHAVLVQSTLSIDFVAESLARCYAYSSARILGSHTAFDGTRSNQLPSKSVDSTGAASVGSLAPTIPGHHG